MKNMTKICRICGKEYKACKTQLSNRDKFNWRAVACSPECGREYFRRVLEERAKTARAAADENAVAATPAETPVVETSAPVEAEGEKAEVLSMSKKRGKKMSAAVETVAEDEEESAEE